MDTPSLTVLLLLVFAGGILGSLGVSMLLRSRRGRSFVVGWKWWGMALYFVAIVAVMATIVVWVYYSAVRNPEADQPFGSPWLFFACGIAAGLPFTLATVLTVRREARLARERARRRKERPASRQERLEFAKRLEQQLQEYSTDLRDAKVRIQGDKGTVVAIHGNVTREQAEKLVHVLRGDLQDLGIERVESGDVAKNWWVRVGSSATDRAPQ
jgi:hypothetical protein